MRPLRVSAAAVLVAVSAAAAMPVATGAASAPRTASVTLKDIRFTPRTATIARGGRVTWRWRDGDTSHNVTIRGVRRSSIKQSGTFSVRFARGGTFRYECTIHPGMTGKVVVR